MASQAEITGKFWKSLRSDMTLMLGATNVDDGHTQPMTAQFAELVDSMQLTHTSG